MNNSNTLNNEQYYFDWAATALPDIDIQTKAFNLSLKNYGNPSSVHAQGIKAKNLLSQARKRCATALGVTENTLYFTSGGTESDYLPILSLLQRPGKGSILISEIEHPAIREQVLMMKNCGYEVILVPPDEDGIISAQKVKEALKPDTVLVCIMAVNNETGAIQPIYEIADAIKEACGNKKKPKLHIDAVQGAGKTPLNLSYSGIDTASISAHKLGGPRGIGLLYMAQRQEPFIRGGGQENGIRSGTENLFGAIALSYCLEEYYLLNKTSKAYTRYLEQIEFCNSFISELNKIEGCTLIPKNRNLETEDTINYSPWIVQASFAKIPGEVMVRSLSEKAIYISTGSACSARKLTRPILDAMKISKDIAANAVRFSFGHTTTKTQIDVLVAALNEITKLFS